MMQDQPETVDSLWARAREWERRTFSNVSVTDPVTGVKNLEIAPVAASPGRSQITIRDPAGHAILKNDTAAGWGLAAPQTGYPSYPAWPAISTTSTIFAEVWIFNGFLYSPQIERAYIAGTEFTDTTAECRIEYSTDAANWTIVTNSVFQSNQDVSDETTVFTVFSGTFRIPITASGNVYYIRLMCRKASGPGTRAFCSPVYLNAG